MGTVSFTATKTCLVCGKDLPRGWRDDTCRGCEFTDDWESRPIEHVLEDLTCEELATIAPFGRSKAAEVLLGEVPMTAEEEDFIRSRRHLVEPSLKAEPMPTFSGARLVPVSQLPQRQLATWRHDIVRAFLASHEPLCRVDRPNTRTDSLRNEIKRGIRELGVTEECYVTIRQGACYLVRGRR